MSKWNKIQKAPSSQFLENEERRKQMIIEAATRRKEKERRMLEQVQMERKNNEQALLRHKQEKKDAYVKYLRNNMHDKYEEEKRKAKEKDPEIKATKWKKKSTEKDQLDALNLELQFSPKKQTQNHSSSNIPSSMGSKNIKRQLLAEQFEKEWQFQQQRQEEMLSSKLLDSLDLDFGTLARDLEINALVNRQKQSRKLENQQNPIDEVRNLIGYESVVVEDSPFNKHQQKIEIKAAKDSKRQIKKEDKGERSKEVNEAEVMNQLKNKKEGKILHWAIEEEAEAEDLFSNCSTKKKSSKALKELNDELRIQKKQPNKNIMPLKVIPEITEKQGIKQKQRLKVSKERKNKSQQRPKEQTNQKKETQPKIPPCTQSHQNFHIQTNAKPSQTTYNAPQKQQSKTSQSFSQQKKNLTRIRNLSRDKQKGVIAQKQVISKEKSEGVKKLSVLPPLPRPGDEMTEATDMQFEIQSYIKQDLINLNLEERQQQEDLRQLHNHNKLQLKQIYNKHNIKTNYHHSSQLTGQNINPVSNTVEQQLEDSIQRLDDLLMRRQIESRGNFQQEQKSMKSIINPLSNSEDLMNQVLRLAENISKFQKPSNCEQGYGKNFKRKVRKTGSEQKIEARVSPLRQDLSLSRQVSQMTSQSGNKPLERPPLILQAGDDSVGRIHINERLRRLLLQD